MKKKNFKGKQPITKTKKMYFGKKHENCGNDKFPKTGNPEKEPKLHYNDPSWYAQDDQLLKDVARFSFAQMAGNKLNINWPEQVSSGEETMERIPGIMKIVLEPTIGASKEATDAPSVAARNLYSYIRHANSGSANYESPDLMMMILAHISAQSYLEELKRVYGVLSLYSTRNRYMGKVLVTSMGYNYDNLIGNLPRLRTLININANKLNSIKIPSNLSISDRWKWCSSHIYKDADNEKAQLFYYQFLTYLKFDGYKSSKGTSLVPMQWINSDSMKDHSLTEVPPSWKGRSYDSDLLRDMDAIESFMNGLIDPLFFEEDVGIMSGDIMKAFGDAVVTVTGIQDDYTVIPEYNTEVLNQIHNVRFTNVLKTASNSDKYGLRPSTHSITQKDGNVIVEDITFNIKDSNNPTTYEISANLLLADFLYDAYDGMTDPDSIMVGTRLIPTITMDSDQTRYIVDVCGSEIPLAGVVYKFDRDQILFAQVFYGNNSGEAITALSSFNWHPRCIVMFTYQDTNGVPVAIELEGWLGDLDNYTVLSNDNLNQLHKVAILSELAYTPKTKLS